MCFGKLNIVVNFIVSGRIRGRPQTQCLSFLTHEPVEFCRQQRASRSGQPDPAVSLPVRGVVVVGCRCAVLPRRGWPHPAGRPPHRRSWVPLFTLYRQEHCGLFTIGWRARRAPASHGKTNRNDREHCWLSKRDPYIYIYIYIYICAVSYTHLTLPTRRTV